MQKLKIFNLMYHINYLILYLTTSLIIVAFYQTYGMMLIHFTHTDDIGVAYTLINGDFCNMLDIKYNKYSKIPILSDILIYVYRNYNLCQHFNTLYSFFSVPLHWTYAPLQFILTNFIFIILEPEYYEDIKFAGRLPSYIFYCIGVFSFAYINLSDNYFKFKNYFISVSLVLVLCFSLELRVMASQMESYATGPLSAIIILCATLSLNGLCDFRAIFFRCLVISIGISMQFQGIFLALSCILAFLVISFQFESKAKFYKILFNTLLSLFFQSILYFPFLLKNYNAGVNWNSGSNNEFIVSGSFYFARILDLFRLLLMESAHNIYIITTPFILEGNYALFYGFTFILFFLLGIFYLYKNKNKNQNNIYIFFIFIFYIIINIFLLLIGKLSFGPTRHSLYFLVPLLIGAGYGLKLLSELFNKSLFNLFLYSIILIISLISIFRFTNFINPRIDIIPNLISLGKFNSDTYDIIIGDSIEPFFIDTLKDKYLYVNEFSKCHKLIDKSTVSLLIYTKNKPSIFDSKYFLENYLSGYYKMCGYSRVNINILSMNNFFSSIGDVEIDISNRTHNGRNSLFLTSFKIQVDLK